MFRVFPVYGFYSVVMVFHLFADSKLKVRNILDLFLQRLHSPTSPLSPSMLKTVDLDLPAPLVLRPVVLKLTNAVSLGVNISMLVYEAFYGIPP